MKSLHRIHSTTRDLVKLVPLLMILISGCRAGLHEIEFERAEKAMARGRVSAAVEHYKKAIRLGPGTDVSLRASKTLGRIYINELKDYQGAVEYFKRVIAESSLQQDQVLAQKEIITIYLNHLSNYEKAIIEIHRILPLLPDTSEQALYRLKLARAFYQLKEFDQVERELVQALSQTKNEVILFELNLLRANNFLAQKNPKEAISILTNLQSKNQEEFQRQNLGLVLAAAFEENLQVNEAIEALKKAKQQHRFPEFIELRIKRLEEKRKVVPGARGFRM